MTAQQGLRVLSMALTLIDTGFLSDSQHAWDRIEDKATGTYYVVGPDGLVLREYAPAVAMLLQRADDQL